MSKIDTIKEKINYLKVWLGILVVTNIGLFSWIFNHFESLSNSKIILSVLATVILTIGIVSLHKYIMNKISELEEL